MRSSGDKNKILLPEYVLRTHPQKPYDSTASTKSNKNATINSISERKRHLLARTKDDIISIRSNSAPLRRASLLYPFRGFPHIPYLPSSRLPEPTAEPEAKMSSPHVAIIGAGPAGFVLALTLLQKGIKCSIYESRSSRDESSIKYAAISLQPNGLRVLDQLGVYGELRKRGYSIEAVAVKDLESGKTIQEGEGIGEAYGYQRLRIYRDQLAQVLNAAVAEFGVSVHFGHRLSGITAETDEDVSFGFANGKEGQADLLVGADGIHSRVRGHITNAQPRYSGLVGVGAEVSRSSVEFVESEDIVPPVTIKRGKAVVNLVPQNVDASRLFVGVGRLIPEKSSEEWAAINVDKQNIKRICLEGVETWSATVQSALRNVEDDTAYIWPIYTMPRLESWTSPKERVAIIGDAAHAVSPITGQGANQAIKDAFLLGRLVAQAPRGPKIPQAVKLWRQNRMQRVHEVVDRLMGDSDSNKPAVEIKSRIGAEVGKDGARPDAWLYSVDNGKESEALAAQLAG